MFGLMKGGLQFCAREVNLMDNIQDGVHSNKATLATISKIAKFEFSYYWVAGPSSTNNSYESIRPSGYIETD